MEGEFERERFHVQRHALEVKVCHSVPLDRFVQPLQAVLGEEGRALHLQKINLWQGSGEVMGSERHDVFFGAELGNANANGEYA